MMASTTPPSTGRRRGLTIAGRSGDDATESPVVTHRFPANHREYQHGTITPEGDDRMIEVQHIENVLLDGSGAGSDTCWESESDNAVNRRDESLASQGDARELHVDNNGLPVDAPTSAMDLGSTSAVPNQHPIEDTTLVGATIWSYHVDADLYLKLNETDDGGPVFFKVHSALIAAASPVWRHIIYGGHNKPDGPFSNWIINMDAPDDRSYGLHLLFCILHYKMHEVPDEPTLGQYHDIAVVASKYECTHLLVPFVKKWLSGVGWLNLVENTAQDTEADEKLIAITWAFGSGVWFSRVINRVANRAMVAQDGTLLNSSGKPWAERGVPPCIVGDICTTRFLKIQEVLQSVTDPLKELMDECPAGVHSFCTSGTAAVRKLCRHMQLGSLIGGLNSVRLYPVPEPEAYRGSVEELVNLLGGVKVVGYKTVGMLPHQDTHANCGISHREDINRTMNQSAYRSNQVAEELCTRAQKCGTFTPELFLGVAPGNGARLYSPYEFYEDKTHFRYRDPVSPAGTLVEPSSTSERITIE